MINLLMAFGIMVVLFVILRVKYAYPSIPALLGMLSLGIASGLLLDYLFGYKVGWWSYNYHQWWAPDYWLNLVPAWSMVITIFILFYSLLRNTIRNTHIRLLIYYSVICGQQEFMGWWRSSWTYNAPLWLILIGWILLLECCVLLKHIVDWLSHNNIVIEWHNNKEVAY